MPATLFIYPWLFTGTEALWDLRYSLRSIDAHFDGGYQVLLIGDRPPGFGNGIWSQLHTKQPSDFFPRCLDVNRKMEWVLQCPWVGEEFVHIHDDQLLVDHCTLNTLRRRVARNEVKSDDLGYGGSAQHTRLVQRTVAALREAGVQRVWNYETHLPRVFNTQKMREVFEKFKPTENRLLYSTLYYNWVHKDTPPDALLGPLDNIKAAYYGMAHADGYSIPRLPREMHPALKEQQLYNSMFGKAFLNYNNKGRTPELLNVLKRMFPLPGPYEVAAPPTTNFLNIPTIHAQA